ncbi:MAG: hypothetical protein FWE87_04085 [Coriobacteriia bacterium]|nr:hypothetical protein [Coriobacteriia bacterium]
MNRTEKEIKAMAEQLDTPDSEEIPAKKKNTTLIIVAGLVGLYVIFGIAAIFLQEPAPDQPRSVLAEEYGAKIVGAHNELMSVDLESALQPGEKLGSVKKSYASNELNKRIKTMRTNADLLLQLSGSESEGGGTDGEKDALPEEVEVFATYILNVWVPFWESIDAQISEVSTTDEALALWAQLKDDIDTGQQGADMEQAFRSFARTGTELGWDKESYTARIR